MSRPILADGPLERIRDLERRLALLERRPAAALDPAATIPAENVLAGTFPSGAFTFSGDDVRFPNTVKDDKIRLWGTDYSLGIRSTTFLARSYKNFLFEKADAAYSANLDMDGGQGPLWRLGNAWFGCHPIYGGGGAQGSGYWAGVGNWFCLGSNEYALLQNGDGRTLLNCKAGTELDLYCGGSNKAQVKSDGVHFSDWIRCDVSGKGIYFTQGTGGWQMQDTTYMRCYGDKIIYTNNKVQGQESVIGNGTWGGGHAVWGHKDWTGNDHCGVLHRYDGHLWIRAATGMEFYQSGTMMSLARSGSYSDIRMYSIPALGGNYMIYATGSGQVGYSSSSRRFKIDKGPLAKAEEAPSGLPIDQHANPVFKFRPVRYLWNDKVANADEVNAQYPAGIAGFFAEDVAAVAPDAVTLDEDGNPTGLDTNAMLAYVVGGLHHTHEGGHNRRVAIEEIKRRLDLIEAVPAVAAGLKKGK